jgi:hypothetical protein
VRQRLLGIGCIAVLCGTLAAGLWPFHSPANGVTWLKDRNGLRFGDYGTVMSSGAFNETNSRDPQPCSMELWLQPAGENGGAILSFYAPDNPIQLLLYQSHTDLVLRSGRNSSPGRPSVQRISVNDVFRQDRPVFVTITSATQGTAVYVNGALPVFVTITSAAAGTARYVSGTLPGTTRASQPIPCTGRIVVGNSPRPRGAWSGQVQGLAIYASELSAPTVRRHYDTWTKVGKPDITERDGIAALYLFDERSGEVVHNHAGAGADLWIPRAYTVLEKGFLEPDWNDFSMSWGYWTNNLKNMAGFVPLGLCFCAYFAQIRKNLRPGLITIVLGFTLSFTIEVLQGFIPPRDSGTTDLITNTLGTWIGAILYYAARAQWRLHTGFQRPACSRD